MIDLIEKTLRLAAMAWIAWLAPALVFAQADTEAETRETRQFTVEVIVFRYADSVSAGTEVFVPDPPPEIVDAGEYDDIDSDEVRVFGDATTGDDELVPIDASGNPIELDADGNPIQLDADGNPVLLDADGNPIELDADGNPIVKLPPRADYVLLLDDELTMLSTWDRLDRLDAYEPLAHFGWHQQVKPFDEPIGIPFAEFGHTVPGLDGELTLYVSRFLHFAVALELNANPEANPGANPGANPYEPETNEAALPTFSDERFLEPLAIDSFAMPDGPTFYRINEDRIFKSGDLRYFDHPRFGVIARIDRVERPEDEEPLDTPGVNGSAAEGR